MADIHRKLAELQQQLQDIQARLGQEGSTECVFVVGCPRSGTSALSWALAEHPAYWTSSEANFFQALIRPGGRGKSRIREAYDKAWAREDGWLKWNGVSFEEFASCIGHGFGHLFLSRSIGRRWVDSSPENLLIAEDLAVMFPYARFVHVVRDGRAVVCSMLESGFTEPWASDFDAACETWAHYAREGAALQRARPDRVLTVRNEALPDECARILEFLRVPSHPGPRTFLATTRVNSSYGNVKAGDIKRPKPADAPRRSWESWDAERNSRFDAIAGDAMRELGYLPAR
jgi:sulfotransferase family protein